MAISGTSWLTPFTAATNKVGNSFLPFGNTANGRLAVPLNSDLNAASNPQDKLQLAGQLVAKLQLQTDTAATTGVTTQLPQMATQASRILGAVVSTVAGIAKSGGGDPATALQPYRQTVSSVLGTLNAVARQIAVLMPETASGVSAQTAAAINQLNAQGAALAKQAGVAWQPVSVRISQIVAAPAATASSTPRLVDIIA